jgi:crotonobetainyl-CoA:carnitine CoA-transferase CaiB-like acyl-CoA transferase
MSASPVRHEQAPPTLGQHTLEVLQGQLGLSEKELEQLRASGVI